MGRFSRLKTVVEQNSNFTLICHERPDGDAIGSLLAIKNALEKLGKNAVAICKDSIPEVYNFLNAQFKQDFSIDGQEVIILVDNGDLNRTGFPQEILLAKQKGIPIINIDHHQKNDLWKIATINYVDDNVSSTAELVLELLNGFGIEIDREIATNLLAGLHNDTGGFKHSNTNPKVLQDVAFLLAKGAKLKLIAKNIANSKTVSAMRLWGLALERLVFKNSSKLSFSVITKNDLDSVNASADEVSGLVNLINSVPETKLSLLICESDEGKIKGSFRTERNDIDLAYLAYLLGGGGHKKAAGFNFTGRIDYQNGKWRVI